ncbi:hypothetical protein SAMN02746073_0053 [Legionella jamestowniensis DSM 19215]|nr:hypothetical protein SAMN02746073_0053 [Legionella jamestowniensis DSM 19215]
MTHLNTVKKNLTNSYSIFVF